MRIVALPTKQVCSYGVLVDDSASHIPGAHGMPDAERLGL